MSLLHRLRHPIRSITEPYGKAGLTVAILALVLATTGAAFAAAGLNSKQKKEVTAIAKKFAGKPGAPGAAGAQGLAGPQGPKGESGTNGTNGTNGKSVVTGTFNSNGGSCHEGGATVEVEGEASTKKFICNGAKGVLHKGETLPSEATETGVWAFGPYSETAIVGQYIRVPIASFAIPLAAPLVNSGCFASGGHLSGTCQVHFINSGGKEVVENSGTEALEEFTPTGCGSGTAGAPEAEPGNLCVFASVESNVATASGSISPSKAGAIAGFTHSGTGLQAFGTWAVTAP